MGQAMRSQPSGSQTWRSSRRSRLEGFDVLTFTLILLARLAALLITSFEQPLAVKPALLMDVGTVPLSRSLWVI